ncbi:MAG: hypothetical protein OXO51_16550, partial [Gemmatimonadota bacterium]|nr:hypothetical protein [Gemmatimonadota bacterium]
MTLDRRRDAGPRATGQNTGFTRSESAHESAPGDAHESAPGDAHENAPGDAHENAPVTPRNREINLDT